jgi:hypothetical protein
MRGAALLLAPMSCLVLLLGAAPASANLLVVTTGTGDEPAANPASGECHVAGSPGTCTLRAAIETAAAWPGPDTIEFGDSFRGRLGDAVVPGAALPPVGAETTIDGDGKQFGCQTKTLFLGPCEEIDLSQAGPLKVEGDDVTIVGVALKDSTGYAIEVLNADGFRARENWVGLNLNGTLAANRGGGIRLEGGSHDAALQNSIAGGEYGIYAEGSRGLELNGNLVGSGIVALYPPSKDGIVVDSQGISGTDAARVVNNRVQLSGGDGIQQRFNGSLIRHNRIFMEGGNGIHTLGAVEGEGSSIEQNLIREATNGVLLENGGNSLAFNEILGSMGAGVRVQDRAGAPASGNVIGSGALGDNKISYGAGPAVEVVTVPGSRNEVARNTGEGNAGLFIDLGGDGPGNAPNGPNDGIQPPSITASYEFGAFGRAEPGATVRLFRKATEKPGEVGEILGEAVADASGSWAVLYSNRVSAIVTASQTDVFGATSELATPAPAPPPPAGAPAGGGGRKPGQGGRHRKQYPQTKIVAAPRFWTHHRTARFRFTSSRRGSRFECRLDGRPYRRCRSPKKYSKLRPGIHVFRVRAVLAGRADPTPAKKKFMVLP